MGPQSDKISVLIGRRRETKEFCLSDHTKESLWEDTMRRQRYISQKEEPLPKASLDSNLTLDFQPAQLWEEAFLLVEALKSMAFCYGNLSRLTQCVVPFKGHALCHCWMWIYINFSHLFLEYCSSWCPLLSCRLHSVLCLFSWWTGMLFKCAVALLSLSVCIRVPPEEHVYVAVYIYVCSCALITYIYD